MFELVPEVDRWAGRTVKARNDLAHQTDTPNRIVEEFEGTKPMVAEEVNSVSARR